jgi:FKBP-type peptidyl-prolyl cis-trans isomerase SlyD
MSQQTIAPNMVVSMNYTLTDDAGQVLDSSQGQPIQYIQGQQNIIPGLEKALEGMKPGDKKQVKVSPQDGYGEYNPSMRFELALEQFGGQTPEPGMMIQLNSPEGVLVARILGVEGQQVMMDANHPLAGQNLNFDVEITEVREASEEELSHGHAHGPGGHHH